MKSGDNIAEIARSFEVPASEIVRLNNLPDNGQIIQVGQILEIPTDVVLVEELPTIPGVVVDRAVSAKPTIDAM